MLITSDFEVPQPVERVWDYLLDVPRMAPNLPGTELTEVVDEDNFKGRVSVKMGPVSLRFAGTAQIAERDEAGRRVVLNASGAEERGKGQASMRLTATLVKAGSGTRIAVEQDLTIAGAAAQYGRGMITDVTNVLLGRFASNIAEDIPRWARGEERTGSAGSVSGLAIGVAATMTALRRVFWRFFGSNARRRATKGA
ncbi:SRPBCC family protein [Actinophytocola oryzae]|uniref:Carbon monoxide dehydrogenase subunit G n=1 Tax=Actinophytocola oryzae TaxID=502181 RepID=A0A4R7VSD6_9PSEU|nr:SRPBCC family protein [Actinophytocola oryzae]TDV52137.1 carbon monoxide dehydrogenase subunit G [Actinophytocola oryzae]